MPSQGIVVFVSSEHVVGSVWICQVLLCLVACTGQIGFDTTNEEGRLGGSNPEGPLAGLPGDPADPGVKPPLLEPGACADATPARLWRLSHSQYENSIEQLLGTAEKIAATFEPESSGTGFRNGAEASFVSARLAEDYGSAAATLSAQAVRDIEKLLDCDPYEAECAKEFIETFGRRAFRNALDPAQQSLYWGLYELAPGPEGIGLVIEAMLQSPYFLYRFELGDAGQWGDRVRLTDVEMAAQLSFLLWDTAPDQALMDAVSSGAFATDAGVLQQVDRMLDDSRAQPFFWNFVAQYFEFDIVPSLDKDEDLFPGFDDEIKTALVEEARVFSNDVIRNQSGTVFELLTSRTAFLNEDLAAFYEVDGVSSSRFEPVELPGEMRAGLLTHGGFLSVLGHPTNGSPTLRGNFVRTRLLCQQIPDPPDDVDDMIKPPGESTTTRERYEEHLVKDSCRGCHTLIDPIGFGFENYDAAGRYRTTESGQAVDATGFVANLGGQDVHFSGPRELVETLVGSDELYDCLTVQFFRYVLGRLDEGYDACAITKLQESFRGSTGSLPELLREIVASGVFTHRVKQ